MSEPTGVPIWVGWSADGADWGWQSLPDAFGITDGESWAQLAVGRDFVIARVETFTNSGSTEMASAQAGPSERDEPPATEAPAARWFIARVP